MTHPRLINGHRDSMLGASMCKINECHYHVIGMYD